MYLLFWPFWVVGLSVVLFVLPAQADSPYTTTFMGSSRFDEAVRIAFRNQASSPIAFTFRIIGEGIVKGVLTHASEFSSLQNSPTLHLKGTIQTPRHRAGSRSPEWVSVTVSGEVVTFTFVRVSRSGVTRYYKVKKRLGQSTAKIVRAPEYVLHGRTCTHGHNLSTPRGRKNLTVSQFRQAATLRQIELGVEADHDFIKDFGNSLTTASSQIMSILATSETVYERDLNLTFRINATSLQTNSTVYPSFLTDAEQLLISFESRLALKNHLGSADAYILFSGKDFDGNIIGIATLGQPTAQGLLGICGSFPTGTIQNLSEAVNWVIFAHELGHILGSEHDEGIGCSSSSGIMGTTLSVIPTSFSACSSVAIANHIKSYGSCLAKESNDSGSGGGSGSVPDSDDDSSSGPDDNDTDDNPNNDSDNEPGPDSPGGGDGSSGPSAGGGGVLFSPSMQFSASLNNRRELSGQVSLPSLQDGCVVEFRASTRKRGLIRGRLVGTLIPTSPTVRFAAEFTSKVKTRKRIPKTVHISAVNNCGAGYQSRLATGSVKLNAARLKVRKRESLSRWYSTLSANFVLQ